jgi:hypothetical protein
MDLPRAFLRRGDQTEKRIRGHEAKGSFQLDGELPCAAVQLLRKIS